MHATIKKMSKQVDKLQQDVEDAKDKLDAAKRKVTMIGLGFKTCRACFRMSNNCLSFVVVASRWFDGG